MATALTVLYSAAASATLSTGNALYTATATPANTQTFTSLNASTGYGEIFSQGTSNAWGAAGSIGNPSGHGFFLDTSILSLAGQQIVSGSWSAAIRLSSQQGQSFTADISVRAFKYDTVATTYTPIITMILAAQSFSGTILTYNLSGTASSASFGTNEVLSTDVWLNVTANSGTSGQQIRLNRLSTASAAKNGDANAQIVTPGYQTTPASSGQTIIRQRRRSFGSVR